MTPSNYHSVVGMILYLANTTRLDILFVINQCARFSNDPKEPHATALKRIGCYLKSTANKGIVLRKCPGIPQLNCWVDANFAGLYSKEDPTDPTSVRSRTGFVVALGENPVVWWLNTPVLDCGPVCQAKLGWLLILYRQASRRSWRQLRRSRRRLRRSRRPTMTKNVWDPRENPIPELSLAWS